MGKKKRKQKKQPLKMMSGSGIAGEMTRAFMKNPLLFIEILVFISTLIGIGLGFAFCWVLFV